MTVPAASRRQFLEDRSYFFLDFFFFAAFFAVFFAFFAFLAMLPSVRCEMARQCRAPRDSRCTTIRIH